MNVLKIFLVVLLLIFGIGGRVSADEISSNSARVDYQLAYPGLLPDHPLYFLKAARDRINSFFISNPVKKAEFNLLQADKRVAAGLSLVQKGKIELAENTFSKGENYFEDGLNRVHDAKTQGVNVKELAEKMVTASSKHQEILDAIKTKINDKDSKKFITEQNRLIELEKRAKELSK